LVDGAALASPFGPVMPTRLASVGPRLLALASALAWGVALAPSAAPAAEPWRDRVQVTVASDRTAGLPPPGWLDRALGRGAADGDLMVCVLDPGGLAQCHHRDGVAAWDAGRGICPGADRRLRARCEGAVACAFDGVPVPSGPFALLILSVEPPAFGVPRHQALDATVFAPVGSTGSDADGRALRSAVAGLAQCLGAGGPLVEPSRPIATLPRTACETAPCRLGRSTVALTGGGHAGRAAADPAARR
jgi:hypothetical protein